MHFILWTKAPLQTTLGGITYARDDFDSLARMPSWITVARPETPEDVAFLSGAALAYPHLVITHGEMPQSLLRAWMRAVERQVSVKSLDRGLIGTRPRSPHRRPLRATCLFGGSGDRRRRAGQKRGERSQLSDFRSIAAMHEEYPVNISCLFWLGYFTAFERALDHSCLSQRT